MTTLLQPGDGAPVTVGAIVDTLATAPLPFRITAFDGSSAGPDDAEMVFHVANDEGLRYILTAPGDLGLARAYLTGDLEVTGVHPADPYEAFRRLKNEARFRWPTAGEVAHIGRGLGRPAFVPPPVPALETPPRWKRHFKALVEQVRPNAGAISHHYDVSNAFYEKVLGPSMAYTCATYADPSDSLEEAQERKFELVSNKLALRPGMRLLDIGCGWGTMVRHAAQHHGVNALGVTLSREQADWGQAEIERLGLGDRAEIRCLDYRDAPEEEFDAVSSIGLLEHVGVSNYTSYFESLFGKLKPGGRMLNHCITRPHGRMRHKAKAFIDRYVFPDGELASPGRIISEAHDVGFEVQHEENLRMSYAHTLAAWCRNLQDNWDFCVGEVGLPTAKLWGLYMAGSRVGFESNWIQLHQVLLTKPLADGSSGYPLRPDWQG